MASSKGSTGTAKANVSEQICQAIQSTSNLLHLMQQSSPSQEQLDSLPKSLVVKSSLARNTGKVLDQLPRLVSSLDAHMETGLRSVSKLKTVSQLLSNMESSQLQNVVRVGKPIETDSDPPEHSEPNL